MDFRLYTFADLGSHRLQQIRQEFGGKALGLFKTRRIDFDRGEIEIL